MISHKKYLITASKNVKTLFKKILKIFFLNPALCNASIQTEGYYFPSNEFYLSYVILKMQLKQY